MTYGKLGYSLFEYSNELLKTSMSILRDDKHSAQRLRLSIPETTTEKPAYLTAGDDGNTWVSVVLTQAIANRDISSYAESARHENAPLNPPMTAFVFQTGVSYINLVGAMNSGSVLKTVTLSRVHHGGEGGAISTTESQEYGNSQILILNKIDAGNTSIACMIIQSASMSVSYAPVPAIGGAPAGSYKSSLTSSAATTTEG